MKVTSEINWDLLVYTSNFSTHISDSHTGAKLIADCDIHAVSGVLKLYLRELPEALFTDFHYPNFVDGLGKSENIMKDSYIVQKHTDN